MQTELIQIGLAFLEGLALIISPCILPILPIILSGSLTGNKSRPFGIILGFIITFTVVTLFAHALIQTTAISQNTLREWSFGILLLLGLIMISPCLADKFNLWAQRLSQVGSSWQFANQIQSGFLGGLIFGSFVGIIWTPCAGPIFAAVIVQVVIQQTTYSSFLIVLAFALGAGVPMFLIAILGRQLILRLHFVQKNSIHLRQLLGFILIATIIYLTFFPSLDNSVSTISTQLEKTLAQTKAAALINGLVHPYPAPAIDGIETWINSTPLNSNQLKDKVVLIDFWTYSCINCLRTLPYLRDWYAKYHDKGLEIIGVHSPEFQFEHDLNNVKRAVTEYGITYPVALDNQFITWRNFNNQYWPAHYLINHGEVVYTHFGEGEYDVTENNIRYLLGLNMSINHAEEYTSIPQTPETYLGYRRAENFSSPEVIKYGAVGNYTFPKTLALNKWALDGAWTILGEKIISAAPQAAIRLHFNAKKVYIVMGTSTEPVNISILLNGKPIAENKGKDVLNASIKVINYQLYSIVAMQENV
ncbi:MAG: cytochrome c biogenesis protein DipZ, partial [Gammaproteobacteria bacterium]|nr:cytochrome c biogenesis protein DipZ [Gammaproteobacteria bacterium]